MSIDSGYWPKSWEELKTYAEDEGKKPHDYSSIAESLVNVTVAMFNYFASEHGMTGFQCGWASMQVLAKLKNLDGPFGIIKGEDLLYPQYDHPVDQVNKWVEEWKPQLAKLAKEKLAEHPDGKSVHPDVYARWLELSGEDKTEGGDGQ